MPELFAVAGQSELLERMFVTFDEPRWTEQVRQEVLEGANLARSRAFCEPLLKLQWLGETVEGPLDETLKNQVRLGGSTAGDEHLGEAESIVFAVICDAVFVTDDAGAYDFARNRNVLGLNNEILPFRVEGAGKCPFRLQKRDRAGDLSNAIDRRPAIDSPDADVARHCRRQHVSCRGKAMLFCERCGQRLLLPEGQGFFLVDEHIRRDVKG